MREKIEDVLRDFKLTVGTMKRESPETTDAFLSVLRSIHKEGALSVKEKELICLGISIYARCEPCIVLHTKSALEAGATKEELTEVCGAALMMGGGSVIAYISAVLESMKKFTSEAHS